MELFEIATLFAGVNFRNIVEAPTHSLLLGFFQPLISSGFVTISGVNQIVSMLPLLQN